MKPDGSEGLPSRVRDRRGNMHVRAAASETGISPTTLLKIERGGLPSPTFAKVGDGNAISQSKHRRYMTRHEVGFDRCDQGKPRWVPLANFSARRLMNRCTHKCARCFDGSTYAAISIP